MQRSKNLTAVPYRSVPSLLLWLLLLLWVTPPLLAGSGLGDAIVAQAKKLGLKESEISFSIRLPTGKVIEHRGSQLRAPASCMKLVVAAAVLAQLGPDHSLKTDLMRLGDIEDGVLKGDLLVIGGGDPAICGRENKDDLLWELRPWISQLKGQGIERIEGRVLADVRYLTGSGIHPDWPVDQLTRWYCAPSGALNLNDNCIDVVIGPVVDGQVSVLLKPEHPLLSLRNRLVPTSKKKDHLYHIARSRRGWEVTVSGKFLATSGERTEWVTVPDPADGFVSVFLKMIEDSGIEVSGTKLTPAAKATSVATIQHSVSSRLPVMLKQSQNLYADALARVLGRESGGDGSFASVSPVLKSWLVKNCSAQEGVVIRDGSGLSRQNLLDARLLRKLLETALVSRWGAVLLDGLSVGAVDGTLARRFRSSPLSGKVRAKTGTIRGVSSLAGVVEWKGVSTPFCLIYQGRNGYTSRARDWQDRSLLLLQKAMGGTSGPSK
ncbi:MAG: D-alanyl-D-alanine carboxypeptidase/D-alanyl-D-alanine-endopeptidase [Planctomycetes bacterium]|mgnify:FL=1|jgi:D-alanyl-D-alanine carboxypeptidase/D-alanyl-D-alanine-endopeptidase (penicillin-binding protein 4)|nr:D-alanyl-D-alanine carboxypeptidase/D-alanyl-D-alanine-endopeptidase [Planctomycetota bacterium]MBT6783872.1 D-alanyl-D-alanine carboxypeptidase/D-alanyl-D-alanine-endopeptidase [Planctomycetota bacterium]MBT7104842.1 D-alanyl-D-alanine carboxypeptidase/D-alanyl-D-alanine-endopeptidase [Planctomycetota bacterium]MBT7638923.1 D-alanyl-D-alanine carboxypeptidase/D-alanyl-D-alanine-endopeptidase [Planctomycetota bacterium]